MYLNNLFLYLNNLYRNKSNDKDELFNLFFCEQFSGPSNYDIDIDFNHGKVGKLLHNINPYKACGPDGIHGRILKNCSEKLAYPLSLFFLNIL